MSGALRMQKNNLADVRAVLEQHALELARRIWDRLPKAVRVKPERRQMVVVRTQCRRELTAAERLKKLGADIYAPICEVFVKRSKRMSAKQRKTGRGQKEARALFPGYLFADLNGLTHDDLRTVPGVYGVLCWGESVANVPDSVINTLRAAEREGIIALPPSAEPLINKGSVIRVTDGPFAGFPGVIVEVKDPDLDESVRVCADIAVFGRPTPVWLDIWQVEVVAKGSHPDCGARKKS